MWYPVRNPDDSVFVRERLDRHLKLVEVDARLRAQIKLRGSAPDHDSDQELLEKRGHRGPNKFRPR